jgi:hypothetical protein
MNWPPLFLSISNFAVCLSIHCAHRTPFARFGGPKRVDGWLAARRRSSSAEVRQFARYPRSGAIASRKGVRVRMPVLILGTITALAVSMSATAEPISAHLVLTIEGGVAESEVTPLFGPLHAGDTLNAVVTFDPGQADLSTDQFNGTFESVSGSIGPIRLTHGEMATGTGPFPDSSNFFSGNVGGEPPGSGRVWFNFIWDRPAAFGDALPQSAREIVGYGPGRFSFDVVGENDASALSGTVQAVAQTPEPSSLLLLATGAALIARRCRERV